MKSSRIGRIVTALVGTIALSLGITACGGGNIGYLWVLGTFRNEISGFQIDQNSGNLTPTWRSPLPSGGTNPVSVVVGPAGRFLYVVNSGTPAVGTPGTPGFVPATGSGISEFAVGGSGVLTFEQTFFSQGTDPIWAVLSNNFLYVLDRFAPDNASIPSGSITAFAIANDTGRLTLVTNNQILNPDGTNTTFFRVGANPIMSEVGAGGCLYTLSPNSVFPLVIAQSGQLTVPTTGPFQVTGSGNLTSINTSSGTAVSYVYLTDAGLNQIVALQTAGSNCSLSPITNSLPNNVSGAVNPVNSVTSSNGRFLYVINQSSTANVTTTAANSSISVFSILTGTGAIQPLVDQTNNPYAIGSGPVCLAFDPSNLYLYTSNNTDSTVTGRLVNQTQGTISNLSRNSVFPTTMRPTCLAVSGVL